MIKIIISSFILFLVYYSEDSNNLKDFDTKKYNLNQIDIDEALLIHNNARSEVAVPDLKWSLSLSKDAAKWAAQMAEEDKMYHSENHTRSSQGENLFSTTATDSITPARRASQLWYDEIKLYTYSTILSGENDFYQIGHYTQMVWKNTTEVGMAMAVSNSGKTYIVARYSPSGNFRGEYPY